MDAIAISVNSLGADNVVAPRTRSHYIITYLSHR